MVLSLENWYYPYDIWLTLNCVLSKVGVLNISNLLSASHTFFQLKYKWILKLLSLPNYFIIHTWIKYSKSSKQKKIGILCGDMLMVFARSRRKIILFQVGDVLWIFGNLSWDFYQHLHIILFTIRLIAFLCFWSVHFICLLSNWGHNGSVKCLRIRELIQTKCFCTSRGQS